MEIKQSLINSSKYSLKCPYTMKPEYITIHNTANDAPAVNEISYMCTNNNEVSFHIAVDDKEAIQGIPYNRNAWHAGDGGKGKGNRASIGIEICYSKSGGDKFNKAYANAVEVTAQLMKMFNIPAANIKYHKDWSGKHCPHRLLDMGINVEHFRAVAQKKYSELYTEAAKPEPAVMYQVVTGSFKDKANAEKRMAELKAKGFDSFIQAKK
jgi:N-acetylmuramoyl-L-alanine amidase CwlA